MAGPPRCERICESLEGQPSLSSALAMRPLRDISYIPWWALTCAHGSAERVPQWVRDLESPVDEVWVQAVEEGLEKGLCPASYRKGPYRVYDATPYAIPYVAQSAHRAVSECKFDILCFLKDCAQRDRCSIPVNPVFSLLRVVKGIERHTIRSALLSCHETILQFVNDRDAEVKGLALWLDGYCYSRQQIAAPNAAPPHR
jgi:hypothetical protein